MSEHLFRSGFDKRVWFMFKYVYPGEYQNDRDRYWAATELVRFVSERIRLKREENAESIEGLYLCLLRDWYKGPITEIASEIRRLSTVKLSGREFCEEPNIDDFYTPSQHLSRCAGHVACGDKIWDRILKRDDEYTEEERAELDRMRENNLNPLFSPERRVMHVSSEDEPSEDEESNQSKVVVKPESLVVKN